MESMSRWLERYVAWLPVVGRSARTVLTTRNTLRGFVVWCEARGLVSPAEVTKPILQRYQRHLYHYRKTGGRPLTVGTQILRMTLVKGFFRWLVRQDVLLSNPASDLELPRKPQRLPREVLSESEVEAFLGVPDVTTGVGLRDRAILELFYSSGLRRRELAQLCVSDLDRSRGLVHVRFGKGNKERYVPVGERALHWVERYLDEVRPLFATSQDVTVGVLFLSSDGGNIKLDALTDMARDALSASGVEKKGACHVLRHTMATLMLEGGADLRYVQAMLGHASMEATLVYTHVAVGKLKAVHARTHPGAALRASSFEPEQ